MASKTLTENWLILADQRTLYPPKTARWSDANVANLTSCRLLSPQKLHENKYEQDGEGSENEREKPELELMRILPVDVRRVPMMSSHVWSVLLVVVMMHYILLGLSELSQTWTSYRRFS